MSEVDAARRYQYLFQAFQSHLDDLKPVWNDANYAFMETRFLSPLQAEGHATQTDLEQVQAASDDAGRHEENVQGLAAKLGQEIERCEEHANRCEEERKLSSARSEEYRKHRQAAAVAMADVQRFIQMADQQ